MIFKKIFKKKKKLKKVCGNCLLYNNKKKECKVAIILEGEEYHMPVHHDDKCHMDELNIPVEQVRWWVEDENGKPTEGKGKVKMEYPIGFFGQEQ
jgi:hypothetical protein